jgi:hypothetical protein
MGEEIRHPFDRLVSGGLVQGPPSIGFQDQPANLV